MLPFRSALLAIGPAAAMAALVLAIGACTAGRPAPPSPTPSLPAPTLTVTVTATPTATPLPTPGPGQIAIALLPESVARYRVREQVVNVSFPSDAVGQTSQVNGLVILDADAGRPAPASRFVVNMRSLRSDKPDRDLYLAFEAVQTRAFPTATFVVRDAVDLPWPLPTNGDATFQLVGDMTIRDVTRRVTWDVEAAFAGDIVRGRATARTTFSEFEMPVPTALFVLSVEDAIRMELDFSAVVVRGATR